MEKERDKQLREIRRWEAEVGSEEGRKGWRKRRVGGTSRRRVGPCNAAILENLASTGGRFESLSCSF